MLEATRRNVTRLCALIDDLLTLSRAEDQRATDMESPSTWSPCCARRSPTSGSPPPGRGDLVMEVSDARRRRSGPRPTGRCCNRAFLNVLTNAVKFSHEGGIVEVALTVGTCRIQVAGDRPRHRHPGGRRSTALGTRFFRASNAIHNEIAGTGLGLRIVEASSTSTPATWSSTPRRAAGTTGVRCGCRYHSDGMPAPMPHEPGRRGGHGSRRRSLAEAAGDPRHELDGDGPRIVPAFPRRAQRSGGRHGTGPITAAF